MKKQLLLFFAFLFSLYGFAQVEVYQPTPFEVCDDAVPDGITVFDLTIKNPEILGNQNPNDFTITYHSTQMDADTDVNPLPNPYTNIVNPQTVYARVEELSSGNNNTITLDLIVNPTPIANTPQDLIECQENSIGTATFDIYANTVEILGTQDPASFTVGIYLTEVDALAGINQLVSPYTTVSNPETLYAIVTSNIDSSCVSNIVSFNLIVDTIDIVTTSYEIFTCGDGQGFAVFDLTENEASIINGNSDLLVSYHETFQDADTGTNQITDPQFYTNSSPFYQTIYIRVVDPNNGCTFVNADLVLHLNIGDLQINQPTPLVAVDDDNDGFAPFNLDDKIQEIIGDLPGVIVTFHETQADATNNLNALVLPYTNIVPNTQTVYVRVENVNGDCTAFVELQLITEYIPFQVNEATLEICSDTTTVFDLTQANEGILDGLIFSDYTIAYYEIYDDALLQINEITDAFTYISDPNIPVVFAGVTETATGDYVITTIELITNQLPIVDFDGNLTICNGGSIVIYPNTNEPNFLYLWNTGDTSQEIVVTTAGTYTVTVTNPITGCANTGLVTVDEAQAPIVETPQDLVSCGTNSVFDLTTTLTEIANGADLSTLAITFHETQESANNGTNPIANPEIYTAISNPQTIFVAVYNDTQNNCGSFVSFNLIGENCPVTVTCGTPVNSTFCYDNDETIQYTYTSSDGGPLQIILNSGQVENNFDELIILDSDGTTNLNTATPYGNGGDLSNLSFISSGDTITIGVESDGSINCQGNGYTIIDYTVGCYDSTAVPNCDAVLTTPQDLALDVNENIDLSWTNATGYVTGYSLTIVTATGESVLDMLDVGNVTTYDVGTLEFATQYFVTVTPYNPNGDAINCNETSFTTRPDPNVIVDCTLNQPANVTFCYENNETLQYTFASNDGSPLYIVFNSGNTENNFDELILLDSDGVTNLNEATPYGNDGDLSGLSFVTTGSTATVYIDSDGSIDCDSNPNINPIDFDVFCGNNIGQIQVNAFLDENNDGIFNGNDTPFTNGLFTYEVNNDGSINTIDTNTGSFTITNQNEANSYDITFAVNPGYEDCFNIPTSLFENITVLNGETVTVDFPITEQMPCEDLSVYLIPFSSPRPGFNHWNDLVIENSGATTIASGTVTFIHDPLVDYVDATIFVAGLTVTPTATGATVDFTNLLPGETRVIWFRLYTPPTVSLGEFVTSSAVYSTAANDIVEANNVSVITQEVIGSYDPNDITESQGRDIVYDDFVTTDEYLYYTIRFQNVGTAEAINVRIENTVNPLLDMSTLQMIRSSHDYVMMQNNNQLTWTFEDINLPAQSQDDFGSNGYVYYRIRPTAGYTIGTMIPNTAEIYFDFNAPVITNTFITEFVANALSVTEFNLNTFSLYPNPAKETVNIKLNNALSGNTLVEVIDIQGKRIVNSVIENQALDLQLNVSNLEAGLYFVKLKNGANELIKKLIVE